MINVLLENENSVRNYENSETYENTDRIEYYSINLIENENTDDSENGVKKSGFKHLNNINQTYFRHFCDSVGYCGKSIKASFYFLCHAIWPDIFEFSGSDTINELSDVLRFKLRKFKEMKNLNADNQN